MILKEDRKALYDRWVDQVCAFLEEAGPKLDRCCSAMQSRPVLDKSPDVVFLGYNAHETDKFCIDKNRFYTGNPYFYTDGKTNWPVWSKLYGVMKWAECSHSMEDDNFVFMNAVFFGSENVAQLKATPGSDEAIAECLRFTQRVVTEIFSPKLVVCFSIIEVFNPLATKFGFREVETLHPVNGPKHVSKRAVKRGWWSNCKVIGIPHPSQAISYDDLGAIALFIKQELTGR